MSPYALLEKSKTVTPGGDSGSGEHGGTLSRSRNWDDFDEDLLDDLTKEEIQELD